MHLAILLGIIMSKQNHDIKIADRCFENVAQFRYLGTTITNQNLLQEEIEFG
jgi:c-di-AMP phosphodiesterase-like protein